MRGLKEFCFIPNRVRGTLVGTALAAIMDIGVVCSIVSQTAFGCADNSTRICNLIKLVPTGDRVGLREF